MEAGIVGLPNVGKSTLFNALTDAGADSANYPFCTIDPNVGVVPVPDDRLKELEKFIPTDKIVPSALRLVDIAGLVKGASQGEGLGNKFLANIRDVDAIVHVVRCFEDEDIAHVDGNTDPLRDIETIETELLLADLQSAENGLDKAKRGARAGNKEAKIRQEILEKCIARLSDGQSLRPLLAELIKASGEDDEHVKQLKSFMFLTAKPVLYVANVDEDDLEGESDFVNLVRQRAQQQAAVVVPVCAKLEAELAELEETDRAELLESVGLKQPALNALARAAYELLGLQSFFTAGKQEIKAWPVPIGASAPQAAGVIHSDFERGFIRAEIYSVDDLQQYKSEKAIRDAGKLRVEGKTYTMQDGDVCHFLFNV